MTITNPTSRATYLTDPSVSQYTYPFKIFAQDQVAVYVTAADDDTAQTPLNLTTDYTVSGIGNDSGGTITLTASGVAKAGTGNNLVVSRNMPFTQTVDYRAHDIFPAETHERALDILTMQDQQLRDNLNRALEGAVDLTLVQNLVNQATESANTALGVEASTTAAAGAAAQSAIDANAAAAAASAAATQAQTAADDIHQVTAAATTLPAGNQATAVYDPSTGVLTFGIPQGRQGDIGPTGDAGRNITVQGVKAASTDLPATGLAGDAWLVGAAAPYDLYLWTVSTGTWQNVGAVTGLAYPLASQSARGLVPENGQPGQVYTVMPDGSYRWGTGLESPITLLDDDITYFMSTSGNDGNDGLTSDTPKATWDGMMSLLASVLPGEHKVTVQVSGLFTGDVTFMLPQYASASLDIVGTDRTLDGFTGAVRVLAGGFTPSELSIGQLQIGNSGDVYAAGKTLRFTGLATPGYAIGANTAMGKVQLVSCTLEYSGAYTDFISCAGGDVRFVGCTYPPIGTPTLSGRSIRYSGGGETEIDNMSALPGGGTITALTPGASNTNPINYPYLTEDTNLYMSTTGDDSNDGRSPTTPKGTWAGMHTLLASIDPRQYAVVVNVSGLFAGDATFALPKYSSANCKLVGTNQATDGFAGTMTVSAGGFEPDKVSFGKLITSGGAVRGVGKTIRITGLATPGYALEAFDKEGGIFIFNSTIEYSGAFTAFARDNGGDMTISGNTYIAIGSPTLSRTSMQIDNGGEIIISNPTALPGGGTITRSNPGNINAYGAAVAGGTIRPDGSISGPSFGILSVVREAQGRYLVNFTKGFGEGVLHTSVVTSTSLFIAAVYVTSTSARVYISNSSNTAQVDAYFSFIVF